MNYYRQQFSPHYNIISDFGPNNPSRPMYPLSYASPIRSSAGGRVISLAFVLFAIAAVGGLVYTGLSFFGFDQITQIYGFDQVIETLKIDPPPNI